MGNAITKLRRMAVTLKRCLRIHQDAFSMRNGNDISGMAFTIIALIVIAPEFPVCIYFKGFSARGLKVPTQLLKGPLATFLQFPSF